MTAELAELLERLDRDPGEWTTICHEPPGGTFQATVCTVAEAATIAAKYAEADVWFGTQPLRERIPAGRRGTVADVVGLRELFADLDVKAGGLPDYDAARLVITDLADLLGAAPVAVVSTGHGLQPHWRIERGPGTDWPDGQHPAHLDAVALLRRWGRLVARVAEVRKGSVDNVYDLARVLRVPGTVNRKAEPKPTGLTPLAGTPVPLGQIVETLDAYGVQEMPEDREQLGEVVAPAAGWGYAAGTCSYVTSMIGGWATDTPTKGRHPWLVSQATRIAAAHRLGCLTQQAHGEAVDVLAARLRVLLTVAPERAEHRREVAEALGWGRAKVATFTDARTRHELNDHQHHGGPRVSTIEDVDVFWQARPSLAFIHAYARATSTAPWAVLGAVFTRLIAAVPPFIVLPATIGTRASLNIYVALVGESGHGKGNAVGVGDELLDLEPVQVASIGSGEGLSHLFARRVGRNKGIERIATAILLDVAEVDTLTALAERPGSTMWAELRKGFMGERLGFAYADPDKRLLIERHTYRLCMSIGVQPGRAGPLMADVIGGTPQRVLFLPTTDPTAPAQPPPRPTGKLKFRPTDLGIGYARGGLRAMTLPDVATAEIIAAQHARLIGAPTGLDGHRLLLRSKVAATLAILDTDRADRMTITAEDWALSSAVMAVSDDTRQQITDTLAEHTRTANRARGMAEGERRVLADTVVDTERTARVGRCVIAVLGRHGDWTTRRDLRREIANRDRDVVDEVLGHLIAAGQVTADTSNPQRPRYRLTGDPA